jgi:alpha-L-fucosidase 2
MLDSPARSLDDFLARVLVCGLIAAWGCGDGAGAIPVGRDSGAGGMSAAAGIGSSGSAARSGAGGTPAAGPAGSRTAAAAGSGAAGNTREDSGTAGSAGSAASPAPGAADGGTTTRIDDPNGHAFDRARGALNVDYAGYLSKHDVVFNKPNTNPLHGLTVGNGRVGAMVWSENGLTLQVSNVDTSPQTAFSAGLVNFSTSPALDDDATAFQQRLSLYAGTLSTRYADGRSVTILGSPNSEVLGIHVEDARPNVSAVTVELSLWDVSSLENSGAVKNLDSWKQVASHADASTAGISRGQADSDHFGYTLAATVEGAPFTTAAVGGNKVRLSIEPRTSYTIWIACATRINAPDYDSVARAKAALHDTVAAGFADTSRRSQEFWTEFWRRSFVQYSNAQGDADYLENVYYLATYMIAAGAYGDYPFHFINGVFRATQDKTKWSNAYWYWNQRDVYHSFLASNHADVTRVFNRLYTRNRSALESFTASRYGISGLWIPETMGWNGNADGTTGSDYTKNILSTGAEVAANLYAEYASTNDEAYLKDSVYPFLRGVAEFYRQKLARDSGTGQYFVDSSNSHETYWNVKNAITDLAAVRSVFPLAIRTGEVLGLDADWRPRWQDVLDHLAAYPTDGSVYLAHDPPAVQARNGENVACELIWPYGVTGIGAPDYAMAVNTWKKRPSPYGNVWANDAIQAARLGLGDETNQGLKRMLEQYAKYPNAMTDNTNGVFEYLGVHLIAMNESLLQSYDGKLRVFPALPADESFVARFNLLAQGGFLVTSERERRVIKYVGLKSLYGKPIKLVNPWPMSTVQVRAVADDHIVFTSADAELAFETTANAIYVVERTAAPLSDYEYSYLTGALNQDAKSLSATCRLGIAK